MKILSTAQKIRAAVALGLATAALSAGAFGQTVLPPLAFVFGDDFERGTLEDWLIPTASAPVLVPGVGFGGTTGLEVTVTQGENHLLGGGLRELSRTDEGYLTFRFDPNGLSYVDPGSGFLPGRSIQIATIKGAAFRNLVGIRFRPTATGYEAFLEWWNESNVGEFDFTDGAFPLIDGWQEITIGYKTDTWVACWIDGTLVRSVVGLAHIEARATVIEVGKTLNNVLIDPSGTLRFDDVRFDVERIADVWVDAVSGNDANDGRTAGTAFATVGRASDVAAGGSTVHLMPGIYRETIVPAHNGSSTAALIFKAEMGPGTAVVRGTERSADLSWAQLSSNSIGLPPGVAPSNIWWTDLSAWSLTVPPRFVVRTDGTGAVVERHPVAREPDWSIVTAYKPSELWWAANGGSSVAGCTPSPADPQCDFPSRDMLQLTDTADDALPVGVEAGNLTTLGNLTGAALVALDTGRGHFHYRRQIVAHNVGAGRVTVDSPCPRSMITDPGLGWGSKYYVEDHPALLDQPGEWWYDESTGRLYLYPPSPGNPAAQNLEIARHPIGFDLLDRSYVTLQDLDLEIYNENAVQILNFILHKAVGNEIRGCRIRYANRGIWARQQTEAGSHLDKRIEGLVIENNELTELDTNAILIGSIWEDGSAPDSWTRSGTFDTVIRGNFIHDAGFNAEANADSTGTLVVLHPDRLTIENNTIADNGPEGMLILRSVIQSVDTWNIAPQDIKTGEILIRNNLVERSCRLKNDCGGIRIWGLAPDNHVYRDMLLFGNVFRSAVGWGWAAEQRGTNSAGQIPGAGGSGIYYDNTSGIHSYRNTLYQNGNAGFFFTATWRDGQHVIYDNVVADNTFGFAFGGLTHDTHIGVDTRIRNNILVNNEGYAYRIDDLDNDFTNTVIDFNLYFQNGWGSNLPAPGILTIVNQGSQTHYPTLADVQANTSFAAAGQEGNPAFADYDVNAHAAFGGLLPDFRLTLGSPAVDAGTSGLPPSLDAVLTLFGITETRIGPRWDQGAFEGPTSVLPIFSDGFESGDTSSWSSTSP